MNQTQVSPIVTTLFVRIDEAVTAEAEQRKWIVLFNGVQQGGMYDLSGAGNREFDSEQKAREWAESILRDIPFEWEE